MNPKWIFKDQAKVIQENNLHRYLCDCMAAGFTKMEVHSPSHGITRSVARAYLNEEFTITDHELEEYVKQNWFVISWKD